MFINMSQKSNVWGSVLSVHGLTVCMLPNLYLLFCLLYSFYQILNLDMFMPIYHYFDTFVLLLLTSCTIAQIHKEILLLASVLIFKIFPSTKSNFLNLCAVHMFGLSHVKKNPHWILLKRRITIHQGIFFR